MQIRNCGIEAYVLWLMLGGVNALAVPRQLMPFPYPSLCGTRADSCLLEMEIVKWNIYPHQRTKQCVGRERGTQLKREILDRKEPIAFMFGEVFISITAINKTLLEVENFLLSKTS